MIKKSEIESLIVSNSSERELQTLLKQDLSVFSEVYANPKSEYIVFSEYPIGSGSADFLLFTSRSKMEVIIIEIKGADFTFSNSDGALSAPINLAVQQVKERFAYIHSNYESFRRNAHDIRISVEAGNQTYNSLLGSNGYLHCDPHKDIIYRGIVIGGRTRDDTYESKLKWQSEISSIPYIKYESWDSWLKKLNRA